MNNQEKQRRPVRSKKTIRKRKHKAVINTKEGKGKKEGKL